MANSSTPPPITTLPPPPLPTDGEALFDAKAGESLTAQVGMVAEINTALAWQSASMASTLEYKTAASQNAAAAAASKDAAAQSALDATSNGDMQVGLAKAQVEVAKTARVGAEAAQSSAQAAAVAAGAAAGLPAFNGAGNLLMINTTNDGVGFVPILPLLHSTALLF